MDLEKIRPCSAALFRRTATEAEWSLADGSDRDRLFFRFWTAKEAILKTDGEGIKGLSRCRILDVLDDTHLLVEYRETAWPVEQIFFDGHVASAASRGVRLEWIFPE
jgi:4'-phosphopantetheinyl transferase